MESEKRAVLDFHGEVNSEAKGEPSSPLHIKIPTPDIKIGSQNSSTSIQDGKNEIQEWKLYLPEDSEFNKKKVMPSIRPIIPLSSLVLDESPSIAVRKDTDILSPTSVR